MFTKSFEISIHALREEGDRDSETNGFKTIKFLSTPSARRATEAFDRVAEAVKISIHALREEGDINSLYILPLYLISIHALREEGDVSASAAASLMLISIHALREEGDSKNRDKISIFEINYTTFCTNLEEP